MNKAHSSIGKSSLARKLLFALLIFCFIVYDGSIGAGSVRALQETFNFNSLNALISFVSIKLPFFSGLSGKIITDYGPNRTHNGSDLYALDVCPDDGCVLNGIVLAPTNMRLEYSQDGYDIQPKACGDDPTKCDYHIFTITDHVVINGQLSNVCMSLGHFYITLPGFKNGTSVIRGTEIGRLMQYPTGIHYHIGLWYVPSNGVPSNDDNNCAATSQIGNRVPLPFTGNYVLDDYSFNTISSHVGIRITSSNAPLCSLPSTASFTKSPVQSIVWNPSSTASDGNCIPELPGPTNTDAAQFLYDITLPPGTTVSPGQSLTKTWREKNTGTSIWSGYNLKFISGEQMGGPAQVAIPTTAPGATVDISVNLVAPSTMGSHSGVWQIVNPSGAWVSGGQLSVAINVKTQSSGISLTMDPPSPSNTSMVRIHALVTGFSNFRALRIKIDGSSMYEIGAPEAYWNWNTSGYSIGQHSITVEVADQTDTSWRHPQVSSLLYTLTGTGVSNNHAPNRPSLVQNPAYDWYVTIGNAPQLCAQSQGDPDNDAITQFHFVGTASVGTVDSGWVSSSCYTFGTITPGTYTWHAQVVDARGGISDWSDSWHFTVEPTGVTAYIDHFSTASPSNAEQIKIYACSSGHAGVNITLRVLVNDANNGTDSGQWHIIKEQGSPCFNDTDAPVWNTLEYGDGSHLVRVVAMAIQPDAGSTSDIVYVLNHRRPNGISLVAPVASSGNSQDAVYLNSRTIIFKWNPTIRAQSYHLYVSTNSSPSTDPSPVFSQTFDSTVNQYSVNFSQNYPALYWQVVAVNDVGSNASNSQAFGIDQQAPACTVSGLASTTYSNVFQVNWNNADALAGIQTSDVQFMDSTRGVWEDWLTSTPSAKTYDLYNGQPGHTYFFRCRATDNANNIGNYPASADTSIMIDPFSGPTTPWWNQAYGQKRNIVILNNMSGAPLPQGYPIHVHFDGTTTPTAAAIFAGSLSNPTCNDLRITYSDSIELDRILQNCSSSSIDLWFRSQTSIAAGITDSTSYQLYYGNVSAGAPPANQGNVFYPSVDANTVAAWYMSEGQGSTLHDQSGNGNNCTIYSPTSFVSLTKFPGALDFAGGSDSQTVDCGSSSAYNLQNFTFETYFRSTNNSLWGRMAGNIQRGVGQRWILETVDNKPSVWIWTPSGDVRTTATQSFADNVWHHLAFTVNGTQIKLYIDGGLNATGNLPATINSSNLSLTIGSAENIARTFADMTGVRLSNIVRTDFSYGAFATVSNEPTVATESVVTPPVTGAPALALLSLSTYPNPGGGVLVEAVVQNQGNLGTQSGFYTDLYLNHIPTGSGDYTNSVRFWTNEPIDPGQTTTLTTIITDVSTLGSASAQSKLTKQSAGGISETSGTLYAQTDSAGAIKEPGDQNTIYSAGTQICTAGSDSFEPDNAPASAALISPGSSQTHNFSLPGDGDWIKFNAQSGQTYLLTTSNLDVSADTYLYLYGTDGQTLLASNDDYNNSLASQIQWTAPVSGTYYVLVNDWNPNTGGCGTRYDFSLTVPISTINISGSAGVAGATLSYTDGTSKIATADSNGNYSFTVSNGWSGTVTPSYLGYTFSPDHRDYANVLADQTAQDYTATAVQPPITQLYPPAGSQTCQRPVVGADLIGSNVPSSFTLTLDGNDVTSAVVISQTMMMPDNRINIIYTPTTDLGLGVHQAVFTYPLGSGPQIQPWSFTVASIPCPGTPPGNPIHRP